MGNPNNYEGGFHFVTYHHNKVDNTERKLGAFRHYLYYLEKGSVRIDTETEVFEAGPGDFFYLPMDISYSAYWLDSAVAHSCGFRLFPESRNAHYRVQHLPKRFIPEFLQIPLESQPDSVALGKFYTLLGKLISHMTAEATMPGHQLLEKLRLYVWRYPDCHVDELALHLGMSKSTMYNTLHAISGKTPHQHILEIQIEKAKNYLLTTKTSIQMISEATAFCNPAYFRKVFKDVTGMTPTQYRKSAGGKG